MTDEKAILRQLRKFCGEANLALRAFRDAATTPTECPLPDLKRVHIAWKCLDIELEAELVGDDQKPEDQQKPERAECEHEYVRHQCVKCGDSVNEDTKDHYER